VPTVTFATPAMALFVANLPQLAGSGCTVAGCTLTLSVDALDVLANLADDWDGHYDGRHVWVGGTPYPRHPRTLRT
jgi:hypothetical protein